MVLTDHVSCQRFLEIIGEIQDSVSFSEKNFMHGLESPNFSHQRLNVGRLMM